MNKLNQLFQELYQNFNNREIELVIAKMTESIKWANGMEGGYVYGHSGVRDYWTRQFTIVHPNVTPLEISQENEVVKVKVHQVVHDLDGKLLVDELLYHYFHLQDDRIVLFDVGEKITN